MAGFHPRERRSDLSASFSGQGDGLRVLLMAAILAGAQFTPEAAPITPQPVEGEVGGSQAEPARGGLVAVGMAQMELKKDFLGDVLSRRALEEDSGGDSHHRGVLRVEQRLEVVLN